jgi:glucose/arabinose dehydrogenase
VASVGLLAACAAGPAPVAGGSKVRSAPAKVAAGIRRGTGLRAPKSEVVPAAASVRLTPVPLRVPAGNGGGALSTARTLRVPKGWTAEVWARIPGARMEAWTPEGDLLVSVPTTGDVLELTPGAKASTPPRQRTILSGLTGPQGLAFARVNKRWVLYVGEYDRIDRYAWSGHGVSGGPTVLASGYPYLNGYGHPAKDIAVGRDGAVFFDVGSSSNDAPSDRRQHPVEAVVMAVRPDGRGLHVVARGVRNSEGLSIAPDGALWGAVNNRDDVTYPFHGTYHGIQDPFGQVIPAYVDNHPPEEVVSLSRGRDLGWPYCNPDQDVNKPAGSLAHLPLIADAVANPGGQAFDCSKLAPIQVGLPAHSAPLGFHFLEGTRIPGPWSGGAVVAVHGSWDRSPPRAPAVLWMAWNAASKTLEPAVPIVAGFQMADGTRWGRVADATVGPSGALYVTDDTAGAVYRLVAPAPR